MVRFPLWESHLQKSEMIILNKTNIHKLTLSGLFIAFAITIPMFMPKLYSDGIFSATLASHVPVILAMFISPMVALAVAAGSSLGFAVTLGPIVALRAAMHIGFAVVGAYMVKKKAKMWQTFLVTLVLHAVLEAVIVLILYHTMGIGLNGKTLEYTMYLILIGTSLHHCVDYAVSYLIYRPLKKNYFSKF